MFIVMEIQTSDTATTLVNVYEDRNDAESKYHQILQYAAKSKLRYHAAVMLTSEGYFIKSEHYEHEEEEVETDE